MARNPLSVLVQVIFCALWTLGASCDFQSRAIVETKVREIMAEQGVELMIPEEETLYDYRFNFAVLGAKSDDPDAPVAESARAHQQSPFSQCR